MTIPGIPGASEPAFRTRDARWMGLDAMVHETQSSLAAQGVDVSLVAVKSAIQLARQAVQEPVERSTDELVVTVAARLQHRKVIMPMDVVAEVLNAYARVIVEMDILEINEIG